MGNYEHIEDTATVEVDTVTDADVLRAHGVDPDAPGEVMAFVDDQIEAFMEPGLIEAATYTDEENSFVLPYEKEKRTINQKRK